VTENFERDGHYQEGTAMKTEFEFEGDVRLLEEFLISRGIEAKISVGVLKDTREYYPDFDPVDGLPRSYKRDQHFVWLSVFSNITELAKKIIEFLTEKKVGQITLTAGGKTKTITRKDSAGNVEEILEEVKGTRITIKVEI
jgi:hypothetical protein